MEAIEQIMELLPVLIPILLIDLGMKIYSIVDIVNENRIVKGNKVIWIVVVAIVNFGWLIYLLLGRDE